MTSSHHLINIRGCHLQYRKMSFLFNNSSAVAKLYCGVTGGRPVKRRDTSSKTADRCEQRHQQVASSPDERSPNALPAMAGVRHPERGHVMPSPECGDR